MHSYVGRQEAKIITSEIILKGKRLRNKHVLIGGRIGKETEKKINDKNCERE